MTPSSRVLDLFAVPDAVEPLPGGQGRSVRAGDLVLSPGRDADVAGWLNPVLARLAVALDEAPARRALDLRVAMPVPARDGSWVVDGWGASRYEPGTVACRDLDVTLAAGRVLHARLAVAVRERPAGLDARADRWAVAERLAFAPASALARSDVKAAQRVAGLLEETSLGEEQLVHADLAGNVLLDAAGAAVVIDVAPSWRPVLWAEAVCVVDSVMWLDAPGSALAAWTTGARRQAALRAIAFRALADEPGHEADYDDVIASVASR
ncbi:hypothetical protein [Nocardioides marinquilinus]|uniref:hypothetical protein n=1 Tax=Nocardioides marinquilinus TaxID=1210400 RepID=UPI0031E8C351